jgi:ketosteroid isomerase-like protein
MSTRNVVDHLADHLAIRDLLDRYTDALNRRDWNTLQMLFCADGAWDAGGPEMGAQAFRFEGAEQCAQGIAGLVAPAELCVQSNHAVVIEVRGAAASARSTINELVLMKDAPGMMTVWGTYYDTLRREADGEWRFQERRFRFSWIDAGGPRGQVLARFPRA